MFIHNKKKKFVLSIVNAFIELLYLPRKLFTAKIQLQEINPRKILLLRLDHIGDVVMTSPSFSVLRERFPQAEIILLTNGAGKQLFSNDHRIDKVLVFNWPWGQQRTKGSFPLAKWKELASLVQQLRRAKIDVLVDFRGDLRFIVLFGLLAGIRIRVSNSRSGKSSLLDYASEYDVSKHEVERSLDVVKCFVGPISYTRPEINIDLSELQQIKQFVTEELNLANFPARLAVIAPYSSNDIKSWPPAYFREVIDSLVSMDYFVVVVGTADDQEDAERMIGGINYKAASLAGKTSVRQLAALTSIATLVVGVDTGVLHIASCFDTPIIAVFGPTRAVEFRPYSPYSHVLQNDSCRCNQFLHVKCDCPVEGYARCMFTLDASAVIKALQTKDVFLKDNL